MSRKIDLTGQRFGRLVAVRESERRGRFTEWVCQCDCGKTTVARVGHLRSGATRSCGCLHRENARRPSGNAVDMAGQRIGRLQVIREDGRSGDGAVCWLCLCECGRTVRREGRSLRRSAAPSCGCLDRERSSARLSARLRGQPSVTRLALRGGRFGRWLVLDEAPIGRSGGLYWACQCDCGTLRDVQGARLKAGLSSSCGCLAREQVAARQRAASGDKGAAWKGVEASYFAKHIRVSKARGRPMRCEECGTTDPSLRYEWASLTHQYDDVNDYRRMCVPCHRRFDSTLPRRSRERSRLRHDVRRGRRRGR